MNAILSGQLGRAFIFRGNDVSSITIDHTEEKPTSWAHFAWAFDGVKDIIKLENVTSDSVASVLRASWSYDRCMQLVLLVLSSNEKGSIRKTAASEANNLLKDESTHNSVANSFFRARLPDSDEFASAWSYVDDHKNLEALFVELEEYQDSIEIISAGWYRASSTQLENSELRKELNDRLVSNGFFRGFAKSLSDRNEFDRERLRCASELKSVSNNRQLLTDWLAGLAPPKRNRSQPPENEENVEGVRSNPITNRQKLTPSQRFRYVNEKKPAIFDLIENGNARYAIENAKQIIDFQIRNKDEAFAAKTLCDFAQRAKEANRFSLQNEFCRWAVNVFPKDGWAHGQLADSFVCLGRLDEAKRSFERCIELGEGSFGTTGIARLHLRRGDLDKALQLFTEAKEEFVDDSSAFFGCAETLRELRRYNEALDQYEAATREFPNDLIGFCGFAAVLTDLGEFEQSRIKYAEVLNNFGDDPVALAGIANTFAKEGDFELAIKKYKQTVSLFPNEPIPLAGLGNVLAKNGEFGEAIGVFQVGIDRFENDPTFTTGLAEAYRAQGDLAKALEAYDNCTHNFPFDAWSFAGKANILKLQNEYEDSLQLYDQGIQKFPSHLALHFGRADLLKNLGKADDGIAAYRRIEEITNRQVDVSASIAAIESARGNYSDSLRILGEMPRFAKTPSDWMANHVYGMALLRQGKVKQAISGFEIAVEKCPWEKEQGYFRRALAIARLKLGQLDSIPDVIGAPATHLDRLVLLCVSAETKNQERFDELLNSVDIDCPPPLKDLRDDIRNTYVSKTAITTVEEFVDRFCIAALAA